jgi:hypothetical protein
MANLNGTLNLSRIRTSPNLHSSSSSMQANNTAALTLSKCFSLQDILPDSAFKPPKSCNRLIFSQTNILHPSVLCSVKQHKALAQTSARNSLKNKKSKNSSISLFESEELNSTRSHTSLSRRMTTENEITRSLVSMPKNRCDSSPELVFCENCEKLVETTGKIEETSGIEGKIMHFLYVMLSCCGKNCATKYKPTVCEECGHVI